MSDTPICSIGVSWDSILPSKPWLQEPLGYMGLLALSLKCEILVLVLTAES